MDKRLLTTSRLFERAFYAVFGVVMAAIAIQQTLHHDARTIVGAVSLCIGFLMLFRGIKYIPESNLPFYKRFAFALFALSLVYISCCMTSGLPSDTQILYDSAAALLQQGTLNVHYDYSISYPGFGLETLADYFCRCPNNILMLLVLTGIYALGRPFGFVAGTENGQVLAVAATAISVAVAVHLFCKCAALILDGNRTYLSCLLLHAAFLAYYYTCTNFYTDIWMLLPLAGGLYAVLLFEKSGLHRHIIVASALWAVAALLKITSLIAPIACCIVSLLSNKKLRDKLLFFCYLLVPLGLVLLVFPLWYHSSALFDFSRFEDLYSPWPVFLLYGAHGYGFDGTAARLVANTPPRIAQL